MSGDQLNPQYLVIGEILRPHGVRGELRMRLRTDRPDELKRLDTVYLASAPEQRHPRALQLNKLRFHQKLALLTLEGYGDRDSADELRGLLVMARVDDLPPLADGEYFLYQLVGMTVLDDQRRIGVVKEVLETGANDVYVVDRGDGEALLPAHEETVERIDFERGLIHMRLPEGLLNDG